jgi:hypothetical protein
MSKLFALILTLALLALAARLTGIWADAGNYSALLFGVAMIVLLLRMINDSDNPS